MLGQKDSASPAARPVNRNNLSIRLKTQGTFISALKEIKKITLATDKQGALMGSVESLGRSG